MNIKLFAEYFIVGLPFFMGGVFLIGAFLRLAMWQTVSRHAWFAREFERRVGEFMVHEQPGKVVRSSFYVLAKRMLERTFYESFALRDRLKRRRGDVIMGMNDRIFLVKPGCAWLVTDILNQIKFLKWTNETPKLLRITRATFSHNPFFNRIFGVVPIDSTNDIVSILPGLFIIAGILGTFVGIAGGLQDLGGMNLQDIEATKSVMDRFLHEIAFAMKTSIAGIIFSLCAHIVNTLFNPERVYESMVDRFESSLDLLWYRSDNNDFPAETEQGEQDPIEALAQDSVQLEVKWTKSREGWERIPPKKAA
jgi:hypothetical protein